MKTGVRALKAVARGLLAAHVSRGLDDKGSIPVWGNVLSDGDFATVMTFERHSFRQP